MTSSTIQVSFEYNVSHRKPGPSQINWFIIALGTEKEGRREGWKRKEWRLYWWSEARTVMLSPVTWSLSSRGREKFWPLRYVYLEWNLRKIYCFYSSLACGLVSPTWRKEIRPPRLVWPSKTTVRRIWENELTHHPIRSGEHIKNFYPSPRLRSRHHICNAVYVVINDLGTWNEREKTRKKEEAERRERRRERKEGIMSGDERERIESWKILKSDLTFATRKTWKGDSPCGPWRHLSF